MENASKALIIAGAILLSILLISLGIMIFNQAQGTINDSGMSQAEITAFNNKFIKYEGRQKGTVAKSALNEIISSNADASSPIQIKVTVIKKGIGTAINPAALPTTTNVIDAEREYSIELQYGSKGYISQIHFKN